MKTTDIKQAYETRRISMEDVDEATNFYLTNYAPRDVRRQTFGVCEEDLREFYTASFQAVLAHNATFGCYSRQTGELAALTAAEFQRRNEPITVVNTKHAEERNPRIAALFRFQRYLKRDLHEALNADKLLMMRWVAVSPSHIGNGLNIHLDGYLTNLAKETKCECMVYGMISEYTIKTCEILGLSVLREINYADYVDPVTKVKPFLKITAPHTRCCVTYRRFEQNVPENKV